MTTRKGVPVGNSDPLTQSNATGNGVPTVADLIRVSNTVQATANQLLGAVDQMRVDVNGRLDRMTGQLNGVCDQVAGIVLARSVETAVATERAKVATERADAANDATLGFRWKVGIGLAATSGLGGLIFAIIKFVGGP
jgi:hypothetical protein